MRLTHARRNRRGVALVQTALVLSTFLMVVFGMLDLGLAVFRKHVVCEAARQGARIAAVHGFFAPSTSTMSAWGPYPTYYGAAPASYQYNTATGTPPSYSVTADNTSDELAGAIRPFLPGLDPSTVTVQIQWPDGTNDLGNRVTVNVSTPYRFFIPFAFGNTITLGASSTMTIAH